MDEVAFRSASELAELIRAGELSAREVLERYVDRIDAYDPDINAVVVRDFERAARTAEAADAATVRGESWGPLHGVPTTVKEAFDVAGLPTTWGLQAYRDHVPVRNAVAVERLIAAGAVVFGKTNVPVWMADGQSFNPIYGVTNNPWQLDVTPGGSSGGAAAALAAGLTALEFGSDVASSIRNPAHFCGVYGHKPSFGIVPTRGHSVRGRLSPDDMNVVGPLARSAADLSLALQVTAGPDVIESRAFALELTGCDANELDEFRAGVVLDDPVAPVDRSVLEVLTRYVEVVAAGGMTLDTGARPDIRFEEVQQVYTTLLHSSISHRMADDEYARAEHLFEAHGASTILGARVLSHRDWLDAVEQRQRLMWSWYEYFERYDFLLTPVRPLAAHPHILDLPPQERHYPVNGVPRSHAEQVFWGGLATVAGLPATVVPAGRTGDGRPVGLQVIGPYGGDLKCLRLAELLEDRFGGFVAPSAYAEPVPSQAAGRATGG